jgi:hypothetical protein
MQPKNGIALLVSHTWIGTVPKKSYNNVPISLNTHRPSMEKPKTRLLQVKTYSAVVQFVFYKYRDAVELKNLKR